MLRKALWSKLLRLVMRSRDAQKYSPFVIQWDYFRLKRNTKIATKAGNNTVDYNTHGKLFTLVNIAVQPNCRTAHSTALRFDTLQAGNYKYEKKNNKNTTAENVSTAIVDFK